MGYRLLFEAWGKGFATEGARALVDYGFKKLGVTRIIGVTHPGNKASQHVLQNRVARTSPPVVFRKSRRDFIRSSLGVASIPHHRFLLVDWMRVSDDYGLPSSLSQAT